LKPREQSLLTVLSDKKDRWGETRLTMEELSEMTGMSRTTLWRALSALVTGGLVETTRTKRNLGRLYKNRYKVLVCETSTADQGNTNNSNDYLDQDTKLVIVKNTSYSYGAEGTEEDLMVNKWKEEDDDQMSFGLIESATPQAPVRKTDPKTRHMRPQEEWTAMDVACEFAVRVYDNIRGIPGMVNTMNLRGALATNRKKHGITAAHEMAIMDKFFGDSRNLAQMKKSPRHTLNIFMAYFTNNIASVQNAVTIEQALQIADELEYLYASDGKKFEKTISGRADLEYYEKKLKEKNE
jgi:AraC-like DNA-binding protein/biotin operon repressor